MDLSHADAIAVRSRIAASEDGLLLTRKEVALALGMSTGGVSNAVLKGRLPTPIRIGPGGRPLWRLGELREHMNARSKVVA